MQRCSALIGMMMLAASPAFAQSDAGAIAPVPFEAPANEAKRIAPEVRDDSIMTTHRPAPNEGGETTLPWQKGEAPKAAPAPSIAPVPFGRGESSGTPAQPDAAYQPKVPFGHAEPSGPVIPSAPHTSEAVPVVGVDAVESKEAAPATPVAPEADPVQQDPAEPTELTSPIFEPEHGSIAPRKIILRVLNKVTAQAQLVAFKPNETGKVGKLQITAISCQKSAEKSQTDYAGLLDIAELPASDKDKPKSLFRGWMYASSPSVTALEHPVYDVTMVRCEMVDASPKKDEAEARDSKDSKGDKKPKAKAKN